MHRGQQILAYFTSQNKILLIGHFHIKRNYWLQLTCMVERWVTTFGNETVEMKQSDE
jgi:hypothetical protein